MKKIMRILILATVLLLQCILLSGCDALDELREKQAFFTENGDIIYGASVYVLLPKSELLQPVYDYSTDSQLNVTEKDVPVLLSPMLSEITLYLSDDEVFLCGYDGSRDGELIYCREDKYEEMVDRIKGSFNPTKACYLYETYNEETNEYLYDYYILSDEEYASVKEVFKNETATKLPADTYIDYDYYIELEVCSDDNLFRRYVFDIAVSGNNYYIIYYVDDSTTSIYTVPDSYNEIFSNIMKAAIEADNYYYDNEEYEF